MGVECRLDEALGPSMTSQKWMRGSPDFLGTTP